MNPIKQNIKSPGIITRIKRYFKASKEANAKVHYVADQLFKIQGSSTKEQQKALKTLLHANLDKASTDTKVKKAQDALSSAGIQVRLFSKGQGEKRILLSTSRVDNEGSFASVVKAIEISGRVNMIAKQKLFKEKVKFQASPENPDSFEKDKRAKLRFSKILHESAKKDASWEEDPTKLFLKYGEADSEMTAKRLIPCTRQMFKKLSPESKMSFCAQLMKAMAFMHSKQLIHRDLKLDNLLILQDKDAPPQLVVCDYGLMKSLKEDPPPKAAAGTPGYMPLPEEGETPPHYAERQDRYALGIILLQITTEFNLNKLVPGEIVDTDQFDKLIHILSTFKSPLCRLIAGLLKQPPEGPISMEEAQTLFEQVSLEHFQADQLPGK